LVGIAGFEIVLARLTISQVLHVRGWVERMEGVGG